MRCQTTSGSVACHIEGVPRSLYQHDSTAPHTVSALLDRSISVVENLNIKVATVIDVLSRMVQHTMSSVHLRMLRMLQGWHRVLTKGRAAPRMTPRHAFTLPRGTHQATLQGPQRQTRYRDPYTERIRRYTMLGEQLRMIPETRSGRLHRRDYWRRHYNRSYPYQ